MISINSNLNVIDNSGAKKAYCIGLIKGRSKKFAALGDLILVVVKTLRKKRRSLSKVKKGELYPALIVRTKTKNNYRFLDSFNFLENSVVLLNKQHKFIGTRIFGCVSNTFRITKFMRIISLSSGSFS